MIHNFLMVHIFFAKNIIVGTRSNRLTEVVRTCTHNYVLEQILEK